MECMNKLLGKNLIRLRKDKGMTQQILAEKSGISAQAIKQIELCKSWPNLETLNCLSKALGASTNDFFHISEPYDIDPRPFIKKIAMIFGLRFPKGTWEKTLVERISPEKIELIEIIESLPNSMARTLLGVVKGFIRNNSEIRDSANN